MPLKCYIYAKYSVYLMCRYDLGMWSHMPHMCLLEWILWPRVLVYIHTLHIIGLCLWTNMPATLHIFVPLHCYCSVHKDFTTTHTPQTQVHETICNLAKYVVLWDILALARVMHRVSSKTVIVQKKCIT